MTGLIAELDTPLYITDLSPTHWRNFADKIRVSGSFAVVTQYRKKFGSRIRSARKLENRHIVWRSFAELSPIHSAILRGMVRDCCFRTGLAPKLFGEQCKLTRQHLGDTLAELQGVVGLARNIYKRREIWPLGDSSTDEWEEGSHGVPQADSSVLPFKHVAITASAKKF